MASSDSAASGRAAGRIVRPAKNGKTQVIRTRHFWSEEAEETFLEELAATCNVKAAAQAAGFSTVAVYRRRMKHAGFTEAWALAIAQGYARLEAMLVERATASLSARAVEDVVAKGAARPVPAEMSVGDAMSLLKLHRASVRGGPEQAYGHREKAPDVEEVRANILRKIEAIERARGLQDDGAERDAGVGAPDGADDGADGGADDGADGGQAAPVS